MNEIKHICLDKDGTIMDVHIYWADIIQKRGLKIIEEFDLSEEDLFDICSAMGVDIKLQRIKPEGPVGYKPRNVVIEAVISVLKKKGIKTNVEQISELFIIVDRQMQSDDDYKIEVFDNIHKALKKMKNMGFKISIYSSDRSKNLQKIISRLKLDEYVDAMVGGDEVDYPKPEAEGFEIACSRVGVPLSNSIYVGDTLDDMIMAKNCDSIGGIGITTGLASKDQLAAIANNVFDQLDELIPYLTKEANECTTLP